jgi:hypothetical protein
MAATRPAGRTPLVKPPPRDAQQELPLLGGVVMSPWGWRILAVFALVAVGLCLTFFLDGHTAFGALWLFVAVAWAGFAWKLWRMHLEWDSR